MTNKSRSKTDSHLLLIGPKRQAVDRAEASSERADIVSDTDGIWFVSVTSPGLVVDLSFKPNQEVTMPGKNGSNSSDEQQRKAVISLALGPALGTAIGVGLGFVLSNLPLGIGIGLAMGAGGGGVLASLYFEGDLE